ncbi:hypothetical protein ACQV5M_15190 [Leptospira sp. SA-E8]|uniref:hypothetical protein n=1 Tax=Leptospira sp. SA-E8 TaxID=3422259 RepID=UPI003EBD4784
MSFSLPDFLERMRKYKERASALMKIFLLEYDHIQQMPLPWLDGLSHYKNENIEIVLIRGTESEDPTEVYAYWICNGELATVIATIAKKDKEQSSDTEISIEDAWVFLAFVNEQPIARNYALYTSAIQMASLLPMAKWTKGLVELP